MNNKKTLGEIIIIIVLIIVLGIIIGLFAKVSNSKNMNRGMRFSMEENKTKETTANDVDEGQIVNSTQINLSEYDSNLTISEAGTYTLSGSFKNQL